MPVRLIPCRHTDTGAETDIPETGLKHLSAYEPIDAEDRKRLGYDKPADDDKQPDTGETPPAGGTETTPTPSKPATGAAKKNKE